MRISGLLIGGAISSAVPQRSDAALADAVFRIRLRVSGAKVRWLDERMAAALGDAPSYRPMETAETCLRMRAEDLWGRMRGMRRLGWHPQVEIDGLERVQRALALGGGVVLWNMRFASATAVKQAFFRPGMPLVHLSHVAHGSPSRTKLGLGAAAPLYCRAENPYLLERVQIPLDGSLRYLAELKRRLASNACVSIFGEHSGRQNVIAPVLGEPLSFAMGAPSLAWTTDAALLTVHPHRVGPFRYRIVVDEPIRVDRSAPRKAFAEAAVQEFARRLERLVVNHPADWQGWFNSRFAVR